MGSKGTNTYTTNTQGPQWLQNAYSGVVGQAQTAAAQPFQPYTGELVAGVNPEELGGIGQINNYATAAQPWLNQAAGYATNAAAPITASQIESYANPFTATVGGATLAELENLNAQQNQNVVGNAISSNAWGGDRAPIAQAELAGQQARAEAPTLANIQSQGYTTGLQTALTEQQQEAQAAYSLGNIGSAMQTLGLTGAGAMIQGGQLQQGTQQALDQARMQQWYTQQGYPFQVASWLAGIESGVGGVAGGTSNTTAPAPNPLNAILGIGAAGAGAYLGAHARGGGIHIPSRYDGGGTIPYEGGINFIPSIQPGRGGAGPPKPPLDPSFMLMYGNRDGGQGSGGSGGLGNIGGALGKYFGGSGGISTSAVGSGAPLEGSADASGLITDSMLTGGTASETAASAAAGLAPEAAAAGDAAAAGAAGFSLADLLPFLALASRGGRINGATGGGVMPEHAGLGFAGYAYGGGPDDVMQGDPSWNQPPFMDETGRRFNQPPPPAIDATDVSIPVRGPGSSGVGGPWTPDNAATRADVGAPRSTAYAQPPVRGGIGEATGLNPSGGVGSSALPPDYADLARRPEDTRSWGEKLSLPLMQAGFAMMASRSPFLGEAIGQGGLSGIGAYVAQEKEKRSAEEKQEDIGLRAKQLSNLAEAKRLELQQRELGPGYRATAGGEEPIPGGPADPATIRAKTIAAGQHIVPFTDPDTGRQGFFNQITGKVEMPTIPGAQPGAPGSAPSATPAPGTQVASADGFVVQNSKLVDSGQQFNYGRNGPVIEKGTPVPDPAPIGGRSSAAIKDAANYYLQTGKLPTGWAARAGNNPVAIQQSLAAYSAQNYAAALAESRGVDPQRLAETWRTAPQLGRFILGPVGQQTVSLGTAMRHLDQVAELAKVWNSGNIQLINKAKAAISREFGDSSVTNLESIGQIVGPEIIKAIGIAGGGSAEERAKAGAQFSTAKSVDQIMGAIQTTQGLMLGQLTGKEGQAKAMGVSPEMFKGLVGEHEYDRLRQLEGGGGGGGGAAGAPIVIQNGYRFQRQPDGSMKNLGPVSTAAPAMAS